MYQAVGPSSLFAKLPVVDGWEHLGESLKGTAGTKRILKAVMFIDYRLRYLLKQHEIQSPKLHEFKSLRSALRKTTVQGNSLFPLLPDKPITQWSRLPKSMDLLGLDFTMRLVRAVLYLDERLRLLESEYGVSTPALSMIDSVRKGLGQVSAKGESVFKNTDAMEEVSDFDNLPKLSATEHLSLLVGLDLLHQRKMLKAVLFHDRLIRVLEGKHDIDSLQLTDVRGVDDAIKLIKERKEIQEKEEKEIEKKLAEQKKEQEEKGEKPKEVENKE